MSIGLLFFLVLIVLCILAYTYLIGKEMGYKEGYEKGYEIGYKQGQINQLVGNLSAFLEDRGKEGE